MKRISYDSRSLHLDEQIMMSIDVTASRGELIIYAYLED